MEFKNISIGYYSAFLSLYNGSFPENERRIYINESSLGKFIKEKEGKFHILILTDDDDSLLGFISFWKFKGYVYIEHFAVIPKNRAKGLGAMILNYIFSNISQDLILEVELPDTEEAKRRIRFYKRNGFRIIDEIDYIQPPYSPSQSGMKMMIMAHGNVRLKSITDLKEMLKEVYNKEI